MALITIINSKGESELVHTSIFDSHRLPKLLGLWVDVWKKVDSQNESRAKVAIPTKNI